MKMLTLTETKLLFREPLALFWGVVFPMVLLAIMGLSAANIGGVRLVAIYEPIVIAFISVAFGVQGIPVQIAGYRQGRVLRRLATTPAGPIRVIGAQLIVSLAVILVATVGVVAVGRLGFGVPLPRQPVGFALVAILSAAAMVSLGLLIGAIAPTARSAGAAGAVLFFPLMYFAGLGPRRCRPRRGTSASSPRSGRPPRRWATAWPDVAAPSGAGRPRALHPRLRGPAARFFRWE